MKYLLVGLVMGMLSAFAFAQTQTCDLTLNMKMTHGDVTDIDSKTVFGGLTMDEYNAIMKDGRRTLDTASKAQDKGGAYAFTFSGSSTCPGNWAEVVTPGIGPKDAARVWRGAGQFTNNVISRAELRAQKGHKHVIGKE
jgi:hypothetical protein